LKIGNKETIQRYHENRVICLTELSSRIWCSILCCHASQL